MNENKKKRSAEAAKKEERTFDPGTHPGAYTTDYDMNNALLDTVDGADDIFKENIQQPQKRANPASPPAPDPPVPNRAHTAM